MNNKQGIQSVKMFRCKICKSVDNYGLVFNPNYKGKGEFTQSVNEHDEMVFNIDGYEFIPDLGFMNSHAACKYCGEIKCWDYYFPRFHKTEVSATSEAE